MIINKKRNNNNLILKINNFTIFKFCKNNRIEYYDDTDFLEYRNTK